MGARCVVPAARPHKNEKKDQKRLDNLFPPL